MAVGLSSAVPSRPLMAQLVGGIVLYGVWMQAGGGHCRNTAPTIRQGSSRLTGGAGGGGGDLQELFVCIEQERHFHNWCSASPLPSVLLLGWVTLRPHCRLAGQPLLLWRCPERFIKDTQRAARSGQGHQSTSRAKAKAVWEARDGLGRWAT